MWDEWSAKSARAKVDDALVADEAVLEALEAVSPADRARLSFPMGPLSPGFDEYAALRLNEHAFHTWDIEVVFDAGAHLPRDAAAVVVDNLGLIARFTGRPTGRCARRRRPHDRPGEGVRRPPVSRRRGSSASARVGRKPDLVLAAEAFCRLVYGRLDADHTPAVTGDEVVLDTLARVFPGP